MPKIIRLIGTPCGAGGKVLGAEDGPTDLRERGLPKLLENLGYKVENIPDIVLPKKFPAQGPGYHNLPEIIEWTKATKPVILKALQEECFPILMGGDHSVAMGSISAVNEFCHASNKKLIVLWLDAHGDFNTPQISPTGNIHGMPLATLCGFGDERLIEAIGPQNRLNPLDVYEVGLRALDPEEKKFLHEKKVHAFGMESFSKTGIEVLIKEILSPFWKRDDVHLHVSFDVDFLDASLVPGTGTPEINGPTLKDAQLCFETIADSGILGSLDIVELNPRLDPSHLTTQRVISLIPFLFSNNILKN